jgi:hypothetical protein
VEYRTEEERRMNKRSEIREDNMWRENGMRLRLNAIELNSSRVAWQCQSRCVMARKGGKGREGRVGLSTNAT